MTDSASSSTPASRRSSLRRRRKHDDDEGELFDFSTNSDDEGFKKYRLMTHCHDMAKLCSDDAFKNPMLFKIVDPKEFTLAFIRNFGFDLPILFSGPPEDLGMTIPNKEEFNVNNVLKLVGGERRIDVVEVSKQAAKSMTLQKFVDYYNDPDRYKQGLFNVLSLEFSLTELEKIVQCPSIVKEIGWFERYWPPEMRARQELSIKLENPIPNFFAYPKVQYYCLMSVKSCYTDFHIDFGGTSVWYHILKGAKVFWLIQPTEQNIVLYEEWVKQGHQSFFGSIVEKCARVELKAGDTFMIPSGWIHSVYTPEDSLVFGGNFMHNFSIDMQFNVHKSESKMKISKKYRFPFFEETLWYVANGIVCEATGRSYIRKLEIDVFPKVAGAEPANETNNPGGNENPYDLDKDIKMESTGEPDVANEEKLETEDAQPEKVSQKDQFECKSGVDALQLGSSSKTMLNYDENAVYRIDSETNVPYPVKFESETEKSSVASSRAETPTTFFESNSPSPLKLNCVKANCDVKSSITTFNDDYLKELSSKEKNGLRNLGDYLRKKLSRKRQDVGEGIEQPAMVLADLFACLERADILGVSTDERMPSMKVDESENTPKSNTIDESMPNLETDDVDDSMPALFEEMDGPIKESADLSPRLTMEPSEAEDSMPELEPDEDILEQQIKADNIERKNKAAEERKSRAKEKQSAKNTKAASKNLQGRRKSSSFIKSPRVSKAKKDDVVPDIIGGMPKPTQTAAKANPYNFDPLLSAAPLGQRPLETMFRKTKDMAKPPPQQIFRNANYKTPTASTSSSVEGISQSSLPGFAKSFGNVSRHRAPNTTFAAISRSHGASPVSPNANTRIPPFGGYLKEETPKRNRRTFSDGPVSPSLGSSPPKLMKVTPAPPPPQLLNPAQVNLISSPHNMALSNKAPLNVQRGTTSLQGIAPWPGNSESMTVHSKTKPSMKQDSLLSTPVDDRSSTPAELSRMLGEQIELMKPSPGVVL